MILNQLLVFSLFFFAVEWSRCGCGGWDFNERSEPSFLYMVGVSEDFLSGAVGSVNSKDD